MWKRRNTFAVTRYFRVIIVVIPMSLALIYFGAMSFPFALEKHTGIIREIYLNKGRLYIELENSSKVFETGEKRKKDIILSSLHKNQKVTIFCKKTGQDFIYKIKKNEEILLDYKVSVFSMIILIIGIGLFVLAIYYLFKSPEDLWGGDKNRMK